MIPQDAGARVALVLQQLQGYRDEPETLVWYTDWSVWKSGERMHIYTRFAASYGVERPLIEVPAFVFAAGELEDLVSFVTLGVLFLWDIFVLGQKGKRQSHFSHDEWGWSVR